MTADHSLFLLALMLIQQFKEGRNVMNLLKNKTLLSNLLFQGDVMNTVNGGVTATDFKIVNREREIVIQIKNPSVDENGFHFIIQNNKLFINVLYFSDKTINNMPLAFPMFTQEYDIPYYIDSEGIEAYHVEDVYEIHLPKNGRSSEKPRRIDIKNLNNRY